MSSSKPPFLHELPSSIPQPSALRLGALYASTSAQSISNPSGYEANVRWWASVLHELLQNGYLNGELGDRLVLKADDELLARLEGGPGLGRPKGLGGVIAFQQTAIPPAYPALQPFQTVISSPTPLYQPLSLTSRFVARPLWYALSLLNPFGGSEDKVEAEDKIWKRVGGGREYVDMRLLEEAAQKFAAYNIANPLVNYTSALYNVTTFQDVYGSICLPSGATSKKPQAGKLSVKDCQVLVKWLQRDMGIVVSDGQVIKVLQANEDPAEHAITEADHGTMQILKTLKRLDEQVDRLDREIEVCQAKAKKHLTLSQKSIALSHLRSKKQLEGVLDKRVVAGEQLRTVLRGIEQAKGDVEIMAAYELSTSTLRSVLSHPSLNLDKVDETMDGLASALADSKEIDDAVRIGGEVAVAAGGVTTDVNDDELADELAALVEEERAAKAAKQERQAQEEKTKATQEQEEKAQQRARPQEGKQTSEEAQSDWQAVHETAQARKAEEMARSEAERLRKDEARVVAE